MKPIIQDQLHRLGISANYVGYFLLTDAIALTLEDESRLLNVTKEIYNPVARLHGCRIDTIERNIRTLIYRTWHMCPKRLIEIAGYPLQAPPTVTEFIDILTVHVRRTLPTLK